MARSVLGVPFGQERGVPQHDLGQLAGGLGGQNLAGEPVPHQRGQVTHVVGVGVGEQHQIDARRGHGEGFPVQAAKLPLALKDAGVAEDPSTAVGHQILRAGDRAGAAEKGEARCHDSSLAQISPDR